MVWGSAGDMVGKAEVKRWQYNFDCHHCERVKYIRDGVRNGFYCGPMVEGRDPIHADDDRIVRCDEYIDNRLEQLSIFDGRI